MVYDLVLETLNITEIKRCLEMNREVSTEIFQIIIKGMISLKVLSEIIAD